MSNRLEANWSMDADFKDISISSSLMDPRRKVYLEPSVFSKHSHATSGSLKSTDTCG